MAYGVIMGQTPILNASGVTYDNSQTSNIITANNVQQAIDESAKKIESVLSWELIYDTQIIETYRSNSSKYNQILIENILSTMDSNNYFMLLIKSNSTMKVPLANYDDVFGLSFRPDTDSRSPRLNILSNHGNTEKITNCLIPLYYNGDGDAYNKSYYTANYNSSTNFGFNYNLYLTADISNIDIFVDIDLKIYGLKAPI